MLKKLLRIVFINFIILTSVYSMDFHRKDNAKGPFYGRNYHILFLPYYNFPGFSSRSKKPFELQYHLATYLANDFITDQIEWDYTQNKNIVYLDLDYEFLVNEIGISFSLPHKIEVGLDLRLVLLYGGFLDILIDGFHKGLGFTAVGLDGGREHYEDHRNEVYINIPNQNGVNYFVDQDVNFDFGDIDLWIKYTFFEKKWIALAAVFALKIPTGGFENQIRGSVSPDFGLQILGDFTPFWLMSFYLQAGLVLPFDTLRFQTDPNPFPMVNGLVGIELHPVKLFSLLGQLHIKNSPIKGEVFDHWNYGLVDRFGWPQVNILVGVKFQYKNFVWQFYFEENPLAYAGADIAFNFFFSHKLKINIY
ncbi:MAG: DUF3187 family protein [Spirochaetes bacterium]|nr:DUF3187 family protein [Spirochaetota bacterium]